ARCCRGHRRRRAACAGERGARCTWWSRRQPWPQPHPPPCVRRRRTVVVGRAIPILGVLSAAVLCLSAARDRRRAAGLRRAAAAGTLDAIGRRSVLVLLPAERRVLPERADVYRALDQDSAPGAVSVSRISKSRRAHG